ncbi:MAG: FUSC family protein [Flavobacteriales bacterium]|nr:FUSC family protein [Flavobacteriales bacterium]
MPANKDYAEMTVDELLVEEKKTRKERITAAVFIGFLIGVMVYGLATKGFGLLFTAISLGLIYIIHRNSNTTKQRMADIRSALDKKRSG